jgi:regulator of sigma E protease
LDILTMIGQFLLALSLLIGLHEFGHFAFAKLFKIRVDKFYIFFDFLFPLPHVANFALLKKKVGETEYGIGWFPLGGYVQIHGMVDETQDAAALASEPQADEFRSKPAWQRLLVMLGGILMNVITGVIIFSALTYYYGQTYLPASEARYGILPNGLGRQMGFRTGDKIVKINGRPFTEFDEVYKPDVLLGSNTFYTVEREGQLVDVNVPKNFMDKLATQSDSLFVMPRQPFSIEEVVPGQPAAKAGLQAGDRLVSIGGTPVRFFDELTGTLARYKNKTVPVTAQRGGQPVQLAVAVDPNGKIGVRPKFEMNFGTRTFNAAQAVPEGAKQAFGV